MWNFIWGGYMRGGIVGAYHWVRCHVWNRYHVVNVSGQDGYMWGWIDRCDLLLLVSFKVLQDFVEEEDPEIGLRSMDGYEYIDDYDRQVWEFQMARDKEIRALYDWWTIERPKNWVGYPGYEREQELVQQDEDMLIRLAKIRNYLWT